VKTGGDVSRPGRTIGGDVRTGGEYEKPGRELQVDPAKYQ
jgi:hypothetical protein